MRVNFPVIHFSVIPFSVFGELFLILLINACTGSAPQAPDLAQGRLPGCPVSPNCVSSQSDEPQQAIAPLHYAGTSARALNALVQIIESDPNARLMIRSDDYLRAEYHTPALEFIDDVEFLFDYARQLIHVRSASRVGYYDFETNRHRIERIRARFAESQQDQSGEQ